MLDVDGWSKHSGNTNSCFKSVEHVVEVTAKETAALGHVRHTDIHTKNGRVWTTARHRAECHPCLEKTKLIVVGGCLYGTYL